jgi:signal transduction histidine kinase
MNSNDLTPTHAASASGLRKKIWVAFILQATAISFAAILGVYGASIVLKHVLIERALTEEADHYWKRLEKNPNAEAPDTFNMKVYVFPVNQPHHALPENFHNLSVGFHSLPRDKGGALIKVEEQHGKRMVLLFKQEQVNSLAFWFGMAPLTIVLAVVYVIAWATYRSSKRAVSPVIWLANQVQSWDPKNPDISRISPENLPNDVQGESFALASALHGFASRIDEFVDRERNFTRDASHELRTPLTVIRLASDMLASEESISPFAKKSVQRIRSATLDMESLIECFLLLARADDESMPSEMFRISDVVDEVVDLSAPLIEVKPIKMSVEILHDFELSAPPRVASIVIGNLVRNACNYTDAGEIKVIIDYNSVDVIDTGIGMSPEELNRVFEPFFRGNDRSRKGQGVGMSIVRRLTERYQWKVEIRSNLGIGTRATVRFA